jgi:2-(1,2-epoxy-1,2-dihydrophenyl)acetyl-CoA isomerase
MEVQAILDRESIRRTLSRYTLHGDRGRIEEFVACFAPDGILEFEDEWTAQGLDGIRERVSSAVDLTATRSSNGILLRHHVSTQGIELVSDSEARAWSYFTAMTSAGPDHVGQYIDQLCRVGGQWLLRHRIVRVEWWSPRTIYVDQAARARERRRRRERDGTRPVPVSDDVRVAVRERVGWITLDRAGRMNRFEGSMREELLAALHRLEDDPAVRCIAITGAGGAFSAGADIYEMAALRRSENSEEIFRRVEIGGRIVRTIREIPKPVVAILDGVAAGAGMSLALACDLRVGSVRAGFASSFVGVGLLPDWGGLHFLARRVGLGRAADLMMTGRRVDAMRALEIGLLEHLFPDASFEDDVCSLLERLVAASPQALAAIKRGLDLGAEGDLAPILAFEGEAQPRLFLSDDCAAGLEAFLDKRAKIDG